MAAHHIIFVASCISVAVLIQSTPSSAFCAQRISAQWESQRGCRWRQSCRGSRAPSPTLLLLASSASSSSASAKPKAKRKTRTTASTASTSTSNGDASTKKGKGEQQKKASSAHAASRKPISEAGRLMHTIKSYLESASSNNGSVELDSAKDWQKTRSYIYQSQDDMSERQMTEVLDFLSSICPPSTVKKIIQVSPRIFRNDVTTVLIPKYQRLIALMDNETFQQAIEQKPDLLSSVNVKMVKEKEFVTQCMEVIICHFAGAQNSTSDPTSSDALEEAQLDGFAQATDYLQGMRRETSVSTEQVTEVLDFLSSICPPSTAKKIVQVSPRVVRKDVATFLAPTSEHFINTMGKEAFQQQMEDDPQLWMSKMEAYHSEISQKELAQYLCDDWGMSSTAIKRLAGSRLAMSAELTARIKAAMTYLASLMDEEWLAKRKKTPSTIIEKMIKRQPNTFSLNVDAALKPRVEYLMQRLNLNETEFTVFINKGGGPLLTLSSEGNVKPMLDFLQTILNEEELKRCVMKMPGLLMQAMETVQSRMAFFDDIEARHNARWASSTPNNNKSGNKQKSLGTHILTNAPSNFCFDLSTNVQPKVDFISHVWGEESLILNLRQAPSILGMSLEGNVKPTLEFFNRTGYVLLSDDWKIIQRGKAAVSVSRMAASLRNRLLPRWYFVQSYNPSFHPTFTVICSATDEGFCQRAGLSLKEYLKFKKERGPDLELPEPSDAFFQLQNAIETEEE